MKKLKVTIVAALSVSANMLACAQDSTQAPVEAVNDGGVEVVREAQATAPAEPPKKVKDAYEEIKSWEMYTWNVDKNCFGYMGTYGILADSEIFILTIIAIKKNVVKYNILF